MHRGNQARRTKEGSPPVVILHQPERIPRPRWIAKLRKVAQNDPRPSNFSRVFCLCVNFALSSVAVCRFHFLASRYVDFLASRCNVLTASKYGHTSQRYTLPRGWAGGPLFCRVSLEGAWAGVCGSVSRLDWISSSAVSVLPLRLCVRRWFWSSRGCGGFVSSLLFSFASGVGPS